MGLFVRLPATERNLIVVPIFSEPLVAVLPKRHSLGRQRSISLQALRDERFVLFPRQHAPGYYDSLVDICRRAGFDPKPVQESEKLHTILSLVAMGRGVSLMPRCVTAVGRKGVVCRPFHPSIPNTELGLVYNPATRSQLVRSFITLVKETLVKQRERERISQARQKDTALRP